MYLTVSISIKIPIFPERVPRVRIVIDIVSHLVSGNEVRGPLCFYASGIFEK